MSARLTLVFSIVNRDSYFNRIDLSTNAPLPAFTVSRNQISYSGVTNYELSEGNPCNAADKIHKASVAKEELKKLNAELGHKMATDRSFKTSSKPNNSNLETDDEIVSPDAMEESIFSRELAYAHKCDIAFREIIRLSK